MKNWPTWGKWVFWIAIILILIAIYNYKTISNKLGINIRKYCDGGVIPMYQDGGQTESSILSNSAIMPASNVTNGINNINTYPFPNYRNVVVTPYSYNQCPDFSTRKAENRMIGGYNNIYFPDTDGLFKEGCPSCIIYNAVTYYYNGYDGKGCYYQVNYNYVWPVFYSFGNFRRGHHGGHGR